MSQQRFTMKPLSPDKQDWTYSDADKDRERGCIGHLRGDFGDGNEFWNTWWQHQANLNTEPFRTELDEVVSWLRKAGQPLFNLQHMKRACREFGPFFIIETQHYQYYLRCNPVRGDYNFYIYCCDRNAQQVFAKPACPSLQEQLQAPSPELPQPTKTTELER
jgi:hypothetical protein